MPREGVHSVGRFDDVNAVTRLGIGDVDARIISGRSQEGRIARESDASNGSDVPGHGAYAGQIIEIPNRNDGIFGSDDETITPQIDAVTVVGMSVHGVGFLGDGGAVVGRGSVIDGLKNFDGAVFGREKKMSRIRTPAKFVHFVRKFQFSHNPTSSSVDDRDGILNPQIVLGSYGRADGDVVAVGCPGEIDVFVRYFELIRNLPLSRIEEPEMLVGREGRESRVGIGFPTELDDAVGVLIVFSDATQFCCRPETSCPVVGTGSEDGSGSVEAEGIDVPGMAGYVLDARLGGKGDGTGLFGIHDGIGEEFPGAAIQE